MLIRGCGARIIVRSGLQLHARSQFRDKEIDRRVFPRVEINKRRVLSVVKWNWNV